MALPEGTYYIQNLQYGKYLYVAPNAQEGGPVSITDQDVSCIGNLRVTESSADHYQIASVNYGWNIIIDKADSKVVTSQSTYTLAIETAGPDSPSGPETYRIRSLDGSKYFFVGSDSTTVELHGADGSRSERWFFTSVSSLAGGKPKRGLPKANKKLYK